MVVVLFELQAMPGQNQTYVDLVNKLTADSNLKCNTCHRLRFADVVTSFVLPAAST